MIFSRALLLALSVLLSTVTGMAMAQTISGTITSGAHDGFDRLVLTLDQRPQWRLVEARTSEIIFDADRLEVSTSGAFDRIDRQRITSIDADGAALILTLGCTCALRVFDLGARRLVVDVVDAEDSPPDETETAANSEAISPTESGYLPTALGLLPKTEAPFARPTLFASRPDAAAPTMIHFPSTEGRIHAPAPDIGRDEKAPRPTILDGRSTRDIALLSEALASASARGIAEVSGMIDDIDTVFSTANTRPGLSVRSVYDIGAADNAQIANADSTCEPRELHDLAAWAEEKPGGLGGVRAALMDDRHRFVPEAMHRLTRYYLTQGFGAEARSIQMYLPADQRRPAYLALADILDGGSTQSTVFAGQALCPGGAALWAVFTGDTPPPELAGGNAAILRSFSSLPAPIRLLLGQELSDRLRKSGRSDDAEVVTNAVARTGQTGTGDFRHAVSRLGIGGRDTEAAIAELEAMIRSTDPNAGQALSALLDHALGAGEKPRPHWLHHAEPLIRANRGTPTADRLRLLWLEGLIRSEDFVAARDAYYLHRDALTDAERAQVRAMLTAESARGAADAQVFEIAALLQTGDDILALPAAARDALSLRLSELGAAEVEARIELGALVGAGDTRFERRREADKVADPIGDSENPRLLLENAAARRAEITERLAGIEF